MNEKSLKVGELAKRTGLTVRTLHHYDSVRLLTPSSRSKTGYRLYSEGDVARLHTIQALRQLGLPLTEVAALLANNGATLPAIIDRQMAALNRQIAQARELRTRLGRLKGRLSTSRSSELADRLATLKLMALYDKYFTPDELSTLRTSRKEIEAEWPPLIAAVRDAAERGLTADHAEVQALARRWISLMMRLAGGNRGLLTKWRTARQEEPALQNRRKLDSKTAAFISEAIEYRRMLWSKYFEPEETARLRAGDIRNGNALSQKRAV